MQIETFQIFCDLAELKSFPAPHRKYDKQSAVSQQLSQLEKAFNAPLIDRAEIVQPDRGGRIILQHLQRHNQQI
jgi:DNA-binding transcriptional LysR family regulator